MKKIFLKVSENKEVTERKYFENPEYLRAIWESRVRLVNFSITHSLNELLEEVVNEAENLTDSSIGFVHFVDENQENLLLQNWSKRTKTEFCQAEGKGAHYPISQAGVWVDCIRMRKPVIHNDYALLPHLKGLPEGHTIIIRELVVPVIRDERIVAVIGVGNKLSDYDQQEIETLSILANLAWEIAERKRTEEALHNSEAHFRKIFDTSPMGMVLATDDFRIIQANPSFCKFTGYSESELKSITIKDITYPDDYNSDHNGIAKLLSGELDVYKTEKRYIRKDLKIVWANLHVSVVKNSLGEFQFLLAMIEDISNKKENEQILRNNEEKYRTLFENLKQGIFYQSADGGVLEANDAALRLFGLSRAQFLEMDAFDMNWNVINENHEILSPEQYPSMVAFKSGKPVTNFIAGIYVPSVDAYNWVIVDAIPQFHTGEQMPYQVFVTMQDISERIQSEKILRESESRLRELNATKDKFFSIISHDLKSPFNAIMGFSELLVTQIHEKDYEGIEEYSKIIKDSSGRAMSLLTNLLEWARTQTGTMNFQPEYIELVSLINEIVELANDSAKHKSIQIIKKIPHNIVALVDKAMIGTVLRNLISNAIKFSGSNGEIVVAAEKKPQEIIFSVSDNGVGMSKNTIGKLFRIDQNLSTKGTHNELGTGLGLILCREFVEKHGGKIWAESEVGKGSKFTFTIPKI